MWSIMLGIEGNNYLTFSFLLWMGERLNRVEGREKREKERIYQIEDLLLQHDFFSSIVVVPFIINSSPFSAFNTFTTFAYWSTSSSFPFFGKCRLYKHEVLRAKLFSMSHCDVHSFYFLVCLISFAPFLSSHHSPMLHL